MANNNNSNSNNKTTPVNIEKDSAKKIQSITNKEEPSQIATVITGESVDKIKRNVNKINNNNNNDLKQMKQGQSNITHSIDQSQIEQLPQSFGDANTKVKNEVFVFFFFFGQKNQMKFQKKKKKKKTHRKKRGIVAKRKRNPMQMKMRLQIIKWMNSHNN